MAELKTIVGECRTYTGAACTHQHNFAQLILPLQGVLCIETVRHPDLCLDESRLFFLPPDCGHTFYAKDRNSFLVLDIPSHLLPQPAGLADLDLPLNELWQALRFLMLDEIGQGRRTGPALASLFHYAYNALLHKRTSPSIDYIHAHYDRAIKLEDLAKLEGYNLTYYCDWFKQQTGLTPSRYIQKLRLDQAKKLLVETNLSILQIAQQIGYEHHASLTRLFLQREGLTPARYRQGSRKSAKL